MFRTYEPARDRLVAVKVFRLDITPEQAQALAAELSRAADAGLFHPSIVEPIAAGVEGTVAYRAEEYVAAETLDVAMRHYAPATPAKMLPFITQLAGAIDFARAAGVGQGALHPRDIFVTPEEARATGFGVVDALERVGLRAPVRRPYSAPERIEGGPWAAPADVFSLAVIAYELLTGRRPLGTGAASGALTGSVAGRDAEALHAVLVKAMDADPARRYPTALAFAAALEAAARGEHPRTLAPSPVVPLAVAMPGGPGSPGGNDAIVGTDDDQDDISGERNEDEAHHALTLNEREREEAVPPVALSDEDRVEEPEAEADLLLIGAAGVASDDSSDRYRDDRQPPPAERPVPRSNAWMSASQASTIEPEPEYRAPMGVVPVGGSRVLPLAATLSLGLLVGFAVGYGVGSREPATDTPAAGASTPASQPAAPAAGKDYSEQAVAPPAGPAPQADAREPTAIPPPVPAEAPAAPAPGLRSTATSGRVVVRSVPSRAAVTVNGTWKGRTPLTLERLPFGKYSVRVVQPGYAVSREDFLLSSEDPARTLSVRLQREPASGAVRPTQTAAPPPEPTRPQPGRPAGFTGSVYVDSRPRGAKVFVDGRGVGTTPVSIPDVPIGSHVIRLELPDHRPWTASRQVTAGREERVTGSLDRIR